MRLEGQRKRKLEAKVVSHLSGLLDMSNLTCEEDEELIRYETIVE
jgi:hypothetical protein